MRDLPATGTGRITTAICIVLIFLVPFFAVKTIPHYHVADVSKFGEWSLDWSRDPRDMYRKGPYCNYPILGVFFSAGLLSLLYTNFDYTTIPDIHHDFRYLLAFFDGLAGLLAGLLLVLLGVRHAFVYALLLTILPANWIVTVFGQIDNVTQGFILGAFAGLLGSIRFQITERRRLALLAYAAGTILLLNGLLVKQLFAISLPALGLAWLFTTRTLFHAGYSIRALASINLTALGLFFYPDFVIHGPDGSLSHVFWIYTGEASDHGARIASDGFNLWLLRPPETWDASSDAPIIGMFTPRLLGTLGLGASLGFGLFYFLRKATSAGEMPVPMNNARRIFALLLLLNAFINLSFNVFMTGTHARHLHHCFGFLLIGLIFFYTKSGSGRNRLLYGLATALVLTGACVYAAVVHSQIDIALRSLVPDHDARAIFFALLLALLSWFWARHPFKEGNHEYARF